MPSQLHSLFPHWFPLVQILSTFLVTKPIVVPAGLTAQLRHLMIAFVLQQKVHTLNSYLLLILLDAVMAQNASPTIAMVVKLPLHGDGLRLKVQSLVVLLVKDYTVMTIPCQSAHITLLLLHQCKTAVLLLKQPLHAILNVQPTLRLLTQTTRISYLQTTASEEMLIS